MHLSFLQSKLINRLAVTGYALLALSIVGYQVYMHTGSKQKLTVDDGPTGYTSDPVSFNPEPNTYKFDLPTPNAGDDEPTNTEAVKPTPAPKPHTFHLSHATKKEHKQAAEQPQPNTGGLGSGQPPIEQTPPSDKDQPQDTPPVPDPSAISDQGNNQSGNDQPNDNAGRHNT